MKRMFTALLVCAVTGVFQFAVADSTNYGRVLYRINAGGGHNASLDTSSTDWMQDNYHNPDVLNIDTLAMGNKTFGTYDSITLEASVPGSVPKSVFQTERALRYWDKDSLEYHFPVPEGQKVEVRLYFAEIYFDSISKRVFDIYIEDQLKLANYDIFAEVGKDAGVMKKFTTTSDGTLNIFLKRVKQMPKINGIEIIEINKDTHYGVYYRVNTGGEQVSSIDQSDIIWDTDNTMDPNKYLDSLSSGNKTFGVHDSVYLSSSVPSSTPYQIFKSERDVANWNLNELTYNFPVAAGKIVEVRLYFAEIYFDNPGQRVFDIYINDQLMMKDLDIFAEAGKDVGIMKSFGVMSNGNVKISLRRVKQQPKVNGIELVQGSTISTVAGLFSSISNNKNIVKAYPNPCTKEVTLNWESEKPELMKLYDSFGREIGTYTPTIGTTMNIDMQNQPKGTYYLKVSDDSNQSETIKLVKD